MSIFTATLRGLTIGVGSDYYFSVAPSGFGPGVYVAARSRRQSEDGARPVGPDLIPSGELVFEVDMSGTPSQVEALAEMLSAAWRTVRSGVLPLALTMTLGERLRFGRPIACEIDFSDLDIGGARARLVFEALDPRSFDSVESSLVLGLSGAVGGLTVPLSVPLVLGAGGDSDGSALNAGFADTPWVAAIQAFEGPIVSPRLTLGDTGAYVELLGVVPSGSVLVVDRRSRSIRLDGSPRPGWLSLSSRWWELPAGVGTVRFRAVSGVGVCTFSWRSASL